MTEQLMLFAEDFLVSHFLLPGSEKARKMTATYGRLCLASSKNTGHLGLLEKMLLASSIWDSMTCLLTWKEKITPQGRLLYQLVPSTPRIGGIESGLLHTPTATANQLAPSMQRKSMLPTPIASDYKGGDTKAITQKDGTSRKSKLCYRLHEPEIASTTYPHPEFVEAMMGFPIGHTDLER